jgi:hypothetical protein
VGALAAVIVAVVVLVSVVPHGGSSSSAINDLALQPSSPASRAAAGASAGGGAATAAQPEKAPSKGSHLAPQSAAPVPSNPLGRQIVQGAQLSLSTRPGRINRVSQGVFRVIGSEKGYVANSSVTSTGHPDSSARFQLEVPSARLQTTLSRLSQLTGQVGGAGQRLAEARALRRSLLKQLSAAFTSSQIDGLKARIARVDQTISRDQTALSSLHRQVSFSRISLTIQGSAPQPTGHQHSGGGGFTLHRAGHDAVHVLVVAAGVLLIALAVAIPVGLVAALVSWICLRARRRSRESALDQA